MVGMYSPTLRARRSSCRLIQPASKATRLLPLLATRLLPLLRVLRWHLLPAWMLVLSSAVQAADLPDPAVAGRHEVALSLESWTDASRQRTLPLRIVRPRHPASSLPMPVILFSHGLGGSREGGRTWGNHWASHGYLVIHLQHPGSDSAVWQGAGDRAAMIEGLRDAMSPQQFIARVADVGFVLDELARRVQSGDPVVGRADLSRIGMSGHSFGAITTQALAGERFGPSAGRLVDARIRASIAFSPSGGRDTSVAGGGNRFTNIRQPFLSLTGTLDTSIASKETAESRQLPFERMPGPDKYLLVLDGADHGTFGGQSELRASRRTRPGAGSSDAAEASIRAVSLMFWNAHLSGDDRAREWLTGGAFVQRLGPSDRWRVKR